MTFHGWLSRCPQGPDSPVGARHQSARRRGSFIITAGAAVLCLFLTFGARAEQPPAGDSPAEPQSEAGTLVGFQQALAERDYDRAYGYVLRWENGDAKEADDKFIQLVRGALELVAFGGHSTVADADVDTNKPDASDWFRRDLMAQVPMDERFWTGCMMRKHQGELRSFKILVDFGDQYRAAGQLFPNIFSRQKDCGGSTSQTMRTKPSFTANTMMSTALRCRVPSGATTRLSFRSPRFSFMRQKHCSILCRNPNGVALAWHG